MNTPPRDELFDTLRTAWSRWDPPPADLVDTILVAIAMDDIDHEYEALTLVGSDSQLAGARGESASHRVLIEFRAGELTVLVRVGADPDGHRLDGWVSPSTGGSVTLMQGDTATIAEIDVQGRFEMTTAISGLSRLAVTPRLDGRPSQGEFRTTLFEL